MMISKFYSLCIGSNKLVEYARDVKTREVLAKRE